MKSVGTIELILFIISINFTPQYIGIDLRIPIYIFWILLTFLRTRDLSFERKDQYFVFSVISLIIIILYVFLNYIFNLTFEPYLALRYVRALLALIAIYIYVKHNNISIDKLLHAIVIVLTLHSVIIIIEIIFPDFRAIMVPFADVSTRFFEYRANGFVNSYDIAGIYTNLLVLVSYLMLVKDSNKIYLITFLIAIVATMFTSRLNMLLLIAMLGYIVLINRKYHLRGVNEFVFLAGIIALLGGGLLFVITTDFFLQLKISLLSNEYIYDFYRLIINTYSDNDFAEIIQKHLTINFANDFEIFFGKGYDTPHIDPGYTRIIFSLGWVALVLILIYNIIIVFTLYQYRNNSLLNQIMFFILLYMMLIVLVGDFKLLYFFTTGIFEFISIVFLRYEKDALEIGG